MKLIGKIKIKPEWTNQLSEIDTFKGYWNHVSEMSNRAIFELKKVAKIDSIGSSTRIEGGTLSNEEIDTLLMGIEDKSFLNRDEKEVWGYSKAIDMIFESFSEIKISENVIKQFHKILMEDVGYGVGAYKKQDNTSQAFDKEGKSVGVLLETTSAFNTPKEMSELIKWFEEEKEQETLHPILLVSLFILQFLSIHPFQDGNGRLSRILTTLLLLQFGYGFVAYCSFESIIEKNKKDYYKVLNTPQRRDPSGAYDCNVWVLFFMDCMLKQKNILKDYLNKTNTSTFDLNATENLILNYVPRGIIFRNNDLVVQLSLKSSTVKLNLKKLVDKGFLKRFGIGKGTGYIKL